jgi:hypothetical protein
VYVNTTPTTTTASSGRWACGNRPAAPLVISASTHATTMLGTAVTPSKRVNGRQRVAGKYQLGRRGAAASANS